MNDYSQYEDKQLIALLRENRPFCNDAFNVIYNRYADRLKSFCLFKSMNKEDAKELHQETWLKFHSIVLAGKNDIQLPAYLYTIARNLSIDKYRLKKNQVFQNFDDFDFEQIADPLNLQSNFEKQDLISMVCLGLNQLSEIYRETFVLKWFAELSCAEIAVVTGETTDCIKRRSSRAMDELIKILNPVITEINRQRL